MLLVCSTTVLGQNTDNLSDTLVQSEDEYIEEVVSLTGKVSNNLVYFKLLIKNEDKSSIYSMVREFENGKFESVGIQYGVMNKIDTRLMYTFVDRNVPNEDFTYTLYRISDESEMMKRWDYCSKSGQLCEIPKELIAMNKK